jgi:hypothetical protein
VERGAQHKVQIRPGLEAKVHNLVPIQIADNLTKIIGRDATGATSKQSLAKRSESHCLDA